MVSTSDQYVCSLPSLLRRFGRRNILTGCCHAHPVASRELVSTTLTFENPRLQGNILIRSEVQKSLESAQWRRTWASLVMAGLDYFRMRPSTCKPERHRRFRLPERILDAIQFVLSAVS